MSPSHPVPPRAHARALAVPPCLACHHLGAAAPSPMCANIFLMHAAKPATTPSVEVVAGDDSHLVGELAVPGNSPHG